MGAAEAEPFHCAALGTHEKEELAVCLCLPSLLLPQPLSFALSLSPALPSRFSSFPAMFTVYRPSRRQKNENVKEEREGGRAVGVTFPLLFFLFLFLSSSLCC